MKHFKHFKSGMSLIEVMIAIAIFATFGSSLFVMQQYAFERMIISQKKLIAFLRMQEELSVYQVNILKELCDYEHGSLEKSLQPKEKDFILPDMLLTIKTKSMIVVGENEKESPLKKLKNLQLICVQAQEIEDKDRLYGQLFLFTYIPEIEKPKN